MNVYHRTPPLEEYSGLAIVTQWKVVSAAIRSSLAIGFHCGRGRDGWYGGEGGGTVRCK